MQENGVPDEALTSAEHRAANKHHCWVAGEEQRGGKGVHTVWVPLTTLSKRKEGASRSSSATRQR